MNLDTFAISQVLLHDIPRGGEEPNGLILTDEPVKLDSSLQTYLRQKIIKSLQTRGLEVVADPSGSSIIRDGVTAILDQPGSLVNVSRSMASHLNSVQTKRNSPGLLAVLSGTVDAEVCVAVVKLEREQGLRFHITTDESGRRSVDLELLRQLTLTNKTKVFKTALFRLDHVGNPLSIAGRVSDDQRNREEGSGMASFYLSTFLGCRLKTNPEKATFDFVQASEAFFNTHITNPEKRGRYQVALLAKMQDATSEIRPRDFASSNLDDVDRDAFIDAIRNADLDPLVAFPKDTSLVRFNGFKIDFANGMVLVGSSQDLQERVRIRPESDRRPGVEVNDIIKRLSGH